MGLTFNMFGDNNKYLERSVDMDSRVINVFVFVYLVFGRVVRPIFMDLVGPFLAFLSVFWVVRDRNDLECGNI